VAHEIGNPLNALHIHLQLIARETTKLREAFERQSKQKKRGRGRPRLNVDSEDADLDLNKGFNRLESFIETSRGEINRLEYIITQFLQAIRPSAPDRKTDQPNKVVLETLDLLRPELDNRGIELVTELDDDLPDTPFDRSQIKQVFVNLIKNAMQAISNNGVLTIRTKGEVEGIMVSIEDNGSGIPSERIGRIFEPYFTTKKKGTGLGLMIVHRIIRDHGGRIMVEPNHPTGTIFRVWLPLFEKQKRLLGAVCP
jgi:two-component system, sporulation sensor kinase E